MKDRIAIQLERLRRHYEVSVRTYDEISLLDLLHVLRVWTELKSKLSELHPDTEEKRPFKSSAPIKKTIKAVRGFTYFLSYLPNNGVTTYASKGNLFSGPSLQDKSFSAAIKVMQTSSGSTLLSQVCFVQRVLDDSSKRAIEKCTTKRLNFQNWLGAETIRLRFRSPDDEICEFSISREMLVKRLANVLDASHSSLTQDENAQTNRFDSPILWLMNFSCGGLPIPYFLALKIAQDILQHMPRLVGLANEA